MMTVEGLKVTASIVPSEVISHFGRNALVESLK